MAPVKYCSTLNRDREAALHATTNWSLNLYMVTRDRLAKVTSSQLFSEIRITANGATISLNGAKHVKLNILVTDGLCHVIGLDL